jgi:hypothetical protein
MTMASKYSQANPNLKYDQNVSSLQIRGHPQKMNIIWIADNRLSTVKLLSRDNLETLQPLDTAVPLTNNSCST